MTGDASFGLDRSMLVNKRSLLVGVTLDARRVRTSRKSCLLEFETAVGVVAVGALHGAFEHLMMEGQIKLVFGFGVTIQAELGLAVSEQLQIGEAGLL